MADGCEPHHPPMLGRNITLHIIVVLEYRSHGSSTTHAQNGLIQRYAKLAIDQSGLKGGIGSQMTGQMGMGTKSNGKRKEGL